MSDTKLPSVRFGIEFTELEARSLLLLRPRRFTDELGGINPLVCKSLGVNKAAARRAAKKIRGVMRLAEGYGNEEDTP